MHSTCRTCVVALAWNHPDSLLLKATPRGLTNQPESNRPAVFLQTSRTTTATVACCRGSNFRFHFEALHFRYPGRQHTLRALWPRRLFSVSALCLCGYFDAFKALWTSAHCSQCSKLKETTIPNVWLQVYLNSTSVSSSATNNSRSFTLVTLKSHDDLLVNIDTSLSSKELTASDPQ